MPTEWFISRDGKQYGPLPSRDFEFLVERGELLPTDLLWHSGVAEWFPATQYVASLHREQIEDPARVPAPVVDAVRCAPTPAETITDEEYRQIVDDVRGGAALIGIDRAAARKLFTEIPLSRFQTMIGEKPYVEKFVVLMWFVLTWLLLIASFPLSYFAFGWWAAAVIPASVVIYFGFMSSGSTGGSGLGFLSSLLLATAAAAYLNALPNRYMGWYGLTFVAALWCARAVYVASTSFMRALVLRNKRSFELLKPIVRRADQSR